MLKKALLLCLIFLLPAAASAESFKQVYINNTPVDIPAVTTDDGCYVSLSAVADELNLKFGWENTLQMAEIADEKKILQVFPEKHEARKNGKVTYAEGTPFINQDTVMVPIDLLKKVFRLDISYNTQDAENNIFYSYHDDIIDIYSKYSPTQDIMVRIAKGGANETYDFYEVYLLNNNTDTLSESLENAGLLYGTAVTDWHSPFVVSADINKDGDIPNSTDFTGGYHSYPSAESSTSAHKSISCTADGIPIENNTSGYCSRFAVSWKNDVQACNTMRADGSGRYVMEEEHKLYFDGVTWYSAVTLTPYEKITITKLYGFQAFIKNIWDTKIQYVNEAGAFDLPLTADTSQISTSELICQKDNNALKITINPSFGIGDKKYVMNNPDAFVTNYGKIYFNLVNGIPLKAAKGDKITYRGSYSFYPAN